MAEFDEDASCSLSYFKEKEEALRLIRNLCSRTKLEYVAPQDSSLEPKDGGDPSSWNVEEAISQLKKIFDKYAEEPNILDPHLEPMISLLMGKAKELVRREVSESTGQVNLDGGETTRLSQESGKDCLHSTGEQTQNFATVNNAFPFKVSKDPQLHALFKVVYYLCNLSRFKVVIRFFPHEVADIEPVLRILLSQDRSEYGTWETRYVLLLWLSVLVLVPFDLSTVDSHIFTRSDGLGENKENFLRQRDQPTSESQQNSGHPISERQMKDGDTLLGMLISECKSYLSDPGPSSEAAAFCLARAVTRSDTEAETHLGQFFDWASSTLSEYQVEDNVMKYQRLMIGILRCLSELFKRGDRSVLRREIEKIFPAVLAAADSTNGNLESNSGRNDEANFDCEQSLSAAQARAMKTELLPHRRLLLKVLQRVGLAYLPIRVRKRRNDRQHASLLRNLMMDEGDERQNNFVEAQNEDKGEQDEDDWEVPEEVEAVVESLLCGLSDRSTITRWTAAKGLGRISARLPSFLAEEVVRATLSLFDSQTFKDQDWHGGCLAVAEMIRRGVIGPNLIEEVLPPILKALVFDVRRGTTSVGSHVRDSACYCCWAMARAFSAAQLKKHLQLIGQNLLTVAVLDREINCRRAASAAFQEHVGRQGHENFPDGITLLTAADYFAVSNRGHSYLEVSMKVARFPVYRYSLMSHLANVKLYHWDKEVSHLAAAALGKLCCYDPQYIVYEIMDLLVAKAVSKEMLQRVGAVRGLSEVVLALAELPFDVPGPTQMKVRQVLASIEKLRLFRGRGGDSLRAAVCRLVECMALANWPLKGKTQSLLLSIIEESIKNPQERISEAAANAFRVFAARYYTSGPTLSRTSSQLNSNTHRETRLEATESQRTAKTNMSQAKKKEEEEQEILENEIKNRILYGCGLEQQRKSMVALVQKYLKLLLSDPNPAVTRGAALLLGAVPTSFLVSVNVSGVDAVSGVSVVSAVNVNAVEAEQDRCNVRVAHGSTPSRNQTQHFCDCSDLGRQIIQGLCQAAVCTSRASKSVGDGGALANNHNFDHNFTQNPSLTMRKGGLDLEDVETRRNAIKALTEICHKIPLRDPQILRCLVDTLLDSLKDYAKDRRGDVGSWVRLESVVAAKELCRILILQASTDEREGLGTCCGSHRLSDDPSNDGVSEVLVCESVKTQSKPRGIDWSRSQSSYTRGRFVVDVLHHSPTLVAHTPYGVGLVVGREGGEERFHYGTHIGHVSRKLQETQELNEDEAETLTGFVVDQKSNVEGEDGDSTLKTQISQTLLEGNPSQILLVAFKKPTMGAYYFPYGIGRIPASSVNLVREVENTVQSPMDEDMATALFDGVLSQACERLDNLRKDSAPLLMAILYYSAPKHRNKLLSLLSNSNRQFQRHSNALERESSQANTEDVPVRETGIDTAASHSILQEDLLRSSSGFDAFEETLRRVCSWGNPSETFPLFVQCLQFEEYQWTLLCSLASSIGKGTKHVSKAAASALSQWLRDEQRVGNAAQILALGDTLLMLLRELRPKAKDVITRHTLSADASCHEDSARGRDSVHSMHNESQRFGVRETNRKHKICTTSLSVERPSRSLSKSERQRLVIPLLKLSQFFLEHKAFEVQEYTKVENLESERYRGVELAQVDDSMRKIVTEMVTTARHFAVKTTDVKKIEAARKVLLKSLSFDAKMRKQSLEVLLRMLGHRYPTVRKATAEEVYGELLVADWMDESISSKDKMEEALEVILLTTWDSEDYQSGIDAIKRLLNLL